MRKQPLTSTIHTLPFDKLDALTFERLCLWLVRAKGYQNVAHYGFAGAEQGRDIVAHKREDHDEELWYFQCKRYQNIDASTLRKEVDKISKLSFEKPELRPAGLVFILPCAVSAKIRDDVKLYCSNKQISCEFWAHTELDMYVKEHPHLIQEFFGLRDIDSITPVQYNKSIGTIDENTLANANQLFASMPNDTIPPISSLPISSRMIFSHNPLFVGREDDLTAIANALKSGQTTVIGQTIATTGLGGIGKSQLASEFVHHYGQFFAGGVFWIDFRDPESISTQVAICGGPRYLNLDSNFDKLPLDTQVDLVLAAWDSPLPRLLVFDNCEDETLFVKWRRVTGGCRIIITTRRTEWSRTIGVKVFPLRILPREESVTLLKRYSSDLTTSEDAILNDIAEELGDLPLALHLAGSFLARYKHSVSPSAYLAQLSRPDLLHHPSLQGRGQERHTSPTLHEQHIARTFALSYERLDTNELVDNLAIKILVRVAYLALGFPMNQGLLFATLNLDENDPEVSLQVEDATHRLLDLGLLEKGDEDILLLHPLLGSFIREIAIETDEAQADVEIAMMVFIDYWNSIGHSMPLLPIQPHLRAVTNTALLREDENAAELCLRLGHHLYLAGDYLTSQSYSYKALALFEKLEGERGKKVGNTLNFLGMVSRTLGRPEEAKNFYAQALDIFDQEDEKDSYVVATVLHNIGMVYNEQEAYSEALDYYRRALAVYHEEKSDEDSIAIAATLNNMGLALHYQGNLEEARVYYEKALEIREEILGEYHQRTAETINNLGGLYKNQGNLAVAKQYYRRALEIYKDVVGEDHPDTARTLDNLAEILQEEDDLITAKQYFEQALEIRRVRLGESHRDTLATIQSLAEVHQELKEFDEAQLCYENLLPALEQRYGHHHKLISFNLTSLGNVFLAKEDFVQAQSYYQKAIKVNEKVDDIPVLARALPITQLAAIHRNQGNYTKTLSLLKQALDLIESEFGLDNIAIAKHLFFVADCLQLQGKVTEARPYYERAIEAYEIANSTSSDYPTALNNLGYIFQNQGSYEKARNLYEKSLNVIGQTLGEKHRDYIRGLNNLAVVYRQMGNYNAARSLLKKAQAISNEILDPEDEFIGMSLHNLATLSYYEKDYQNAAMLMQRAIFIGERALGVNHPQTQLSRESLGLIMRDMHMAQLNKTHQDRRTKMPRNAPCPCGSGRKYKHCCGSVPSR